MASITIEPSVIEQGGRVKLTLVLNQAERKQQLSNVNWKITDDGEAEPDPRDPHRAVWNVPNGQTLGSHTVTVHFTLGSNQVEESENLRVTARPLASGDTLNVSTSLRRTEVTPSDDQAFWVAIRRSSNVLSFNGYREFIEPIMCGGAIREIPGRRPDLPVTGSLPFPDIDAYRLLKIATETFMMIQCGVLLDPEAAGRPFEGVETGPELDRLGRSGAVSDDIFQRDIQEAWRRYIGRAEGSPRVDGEEEHPFLPYLAVIRERLGDLRLLDQQQFGRECYGILREKFTRPCLLELIWSYWHEEGMLVQTIGAIADRFQNLRGAGERDPLSELAIDPLRPLNNLLWGYVQDEQHRLTAYRRAYEYDHEYGITLLPPTVPPLRSAESRSRFLESFHHLLRLASVFFQQDDDTTVIADGFPLLSALRDLHLLLTEGQHNQYGDLPWTARQEMLMEQWLLARPEMREFLPTRTMVAYPEPWMGAVDSMKRLQGWTDTSVVHFRDLARFGEQILLSARFGNWAAINDRAQAANWARYWRSEIQGYIHAYMTATGVNIAADLSAARINTTMPAIHLRRRLVEQHQSRQAAPLRQAPAPRGRIEAGRQQAAVPSGRRRAIPAALPPSPSGQQPVSGAIVRRPPRPDGR
jgi:hypothetical protein